MTTKLINSNLKFHAQLRVTVIIVNQVSIDPVVFLDKIEANKRGMRHETTKPSCGEELSTFYSAVCAHEISDPILCESSKY